MNSRARTRQIRAHMAATGLSYNKAALDLQRIQAAPARAAKSRKRFYVIAEFSEATGLRPFQIERAVTAGLIPPADMTPGGRARWTADVVDATKPRTAHIAETVGSVPSMAVYEAAQYLSAKFERDVTTDTVRELAYQKHLVRRKVQSGSSQFFVYDGRSLEAFSDSKAISRADHEGRTIITSQVVELLGVRRSDVDALIERGWLRVHRYTQNPNVSKSSPSANMALFRAGDVIDLLGNLAIDWEAMRAVKKGARSPFLKLPPA